MKSRWYVYIISNYINSVFYTGMTNNLQRRVWEHKQCINKNSFSSKYRLYKLVWFKEFASPSEAILIEKKVKDYRHNKKLNLIKVIDDVRTIIQAQNLLPRNLLYKTAYRL